MSCCSSEICGGCSLRNLDFQEYSKHKEKSFLKLLSHIRQENIKVDKAVFIPDGHRRRASLSFEYKKRQLVFGFNQKNTNIITDINACALLTPALNECLPGLRSLLTQLCSVKIVEKIKKKLITSNISTGSVYICEADNGMDILLNIDGRINVDIRQLIFDFAHEHDKIIRISVKMHGHQSETIIEKLKPVVNISKANVLIPPSAFLQASKQAETEMIKIVLKYLGQSAGNIADLFCGIGTFSYPLAENIKNKVTAVDSSAESLQSFQETINKNMIPNIKILNRNLFKYPLTEEELSEFATIVFDPPRAGASAQVRHIKSPSRVIAVSCNPHTFINDANTLISNGYNLNNITLVDQFTYSNHSELVALFTK